MDLHVVEMQNKVHINEIRRDAIRQSYVNQYDEETRVVYIALFIGFGMIVMLIAFLVYYVISL